MGKTSPAIFLMIVLVVTAGETTEAKSWWNKVGDVVGNVAENVVKNVVGNFKTVEMGLSLTGGSCVREILSVSTNVFSEWCIARDDPRAPMYMQIEKLPNDLSVESLLKMPIDYIKNNYPNFWKVWIFNQRTKKRPRRALLSF